MEYWIYIMPIAATILSIIIAFRNSFSYFRSTKKQKEELERYLAKSHVFINLQKNLINSKKLDEKLVLRDFESANNLFKRLFDDMTQSNCRTTIKVISYDDSVPVVISLVSQTMKRKYRQAIYMHKSNLFDDSSLSYLFYKPFDYYLDNDLGKFYKNIHFPNLTDSNRKYILYYSTLVVPIVKLEKHHQDDCVIYGFLSIDSDRRGAFKKDIHVSIAKSFANTLTPYFETWTKKIIEREGLLQSNSSLPEST